jgi:ribokinase
MTGGPDLIFIGQVTIDDVVPAQAGPWTREIGGSSLYGIAGARLWLDPERIGIVARVGHDYPFDIARVLGEAGVGHIALRPVASEHLVEWLIYEEDGSRRSLPRNRGLRDVGAEGSSSMQPYLDLLLQISPSDEDVPADWLPAPAIHLCPQVGTRHPDSLAALRGQAGRITVDPSPHYSRRHDAAGLAALLAGATALLPSEQEIRPLIEAMGAADAVRALHEAGLEEVVLKRGGAPVLLATGGEVSTIPIAPVRIIDPTGAGDAFCGAYAACRLIGYDCIEAARRAAASAALVVGCSGAEQALGLQRPGVG